MSNKTIYDLAAERGRTPEGLIGETLHLADGCLPTQSPRTVVVRAVIPGFFIDQPDLHVVTAGDSDYEQAFSTLAEQYDCVVDS